MDTFKHSIDIQFQSHKGINLFNQEVLSTLAFTDETREAIRNIRSLEKEEEETLIEYVTNKAVREFCNANQYYNFTQNDRILLRVIYSELVTTLRDGSVSIDSTAEEHYRKLTNWLKTSNPFAERIYASEKKTVQPVVCAEYSPEFQLNILHVNLPEIKEPLLDIGCGENGNLVLYLRALGMEAFGFDRFAGNNRYLMKCDWFDFTFEKGYWGTIVSNLGFTNHFFHHHLREDGKFIQYSKKYMEILTSLQPGASFYYAPGVPFIERFLMPSQFKVEKFETTGGILTVKVTKMG